MRRIPDVPASKRVLWVIVARALAGAVSQLVPVVAAAADLGAVLEVWPEEDVGAAEGVVAVVEEEEVAAVVAVVVVVVVDQGEIEFGI